MFLNGINLDIPTLSPTNTWPYIHIECLLLWWDIQRKLDDINKNKMFVIIYYYIYHDEDYGHQTNTVWWLKYVLFGCLIDILIVYGWEDIIETSHYSNISPTIFPTLGIFNGHLNVHFVGIWLFVILWYNFCRCSLQIIWFIFSRNYIYYICLRYIWMR